MDGGPDATRSFASWCGLEGQVLQWLDLGARRGEEKSDLVLDLVDLESVNADDLVAAVDWG